MLRTESVSEFYILADASAPGAFEVIFESESRAENGIDALETWRGWLAQCDRQCALEVLADGEPLFARVPDVNASGFVGMTAKRVNTGAGRFLRGAAKDRAGRFALVTVEFHVSYYD